MRRLSIKKAIALAIESYELDGAADHKGAWWVHEMTSGIRTGGASGRRSQHEADNMCEIKRMFHALDLIDSGHDWHAYDWSGLSGPAADRVHQMIARRKEVECARIKAGVMENLLNALTSRNK